MHSCLISMHALDTRRIILSILLIVTSNLSDTARITSEFDIDQTNAKTCCWRGIGAPINGTKVNHGARTSKYFALLLFSIVTRDGIKRDSFAFGCPPVRRGHVM